MVSFYSENDFTPEHPEELNNWIRKIVEGEDYELGEVSVVFCNDDYLLEINQKFLDHDDYTDIITFDYNLGKQINSEIYISTERVAENASTFNCSFTDELHRVIIHGILHLCGYSDKDRTEKSTMRAKENEALLSRDFA